MSSLCPITKGVVLFAGTKISFAVSEFARIVLPASSNVIVYVAVFIFESSGVESEADLQLLPSKY